MTQPLPEWTRPFIGIPWRAGGSDFDGCDCWGLVRLVIAERTGIVLPNYSANYPHGLDGAALRQELECLMAAREREFVEVAAGLRPLDIAWLPRAGHYCHVAVVVADRRAVHITAKMTNSEAIDFRHARWRGVSGRILYKRHPSLETRLDGAADGPQGAQWTAP